MTERSDQSSGEAMAVTAFRNEAGSMAGNRYSSGSIASRRRNVTAQSSLEADQSSNKGVVPGVCGVAVRASEQGVERVLGSLGVAG